LCDININGPKDGIDIAEHVYQNKKTPLIFVTALSDKGTLERAKKTLPYGYIIKPFDNHDLLSAIELGLYRHSIELEKLAITMEKINKITSEPLTEREYEILIDITKGLNNTQISESKFITVSTVKYHIHKLLEKMEVKSRSDALSKLFDLLTQ
jgi:DNA-binding NarL/FixJ family response regulator